MGLLTAKTCCFCLDLRTGSLAIGYLFLFGSIFGILQPTFKQIQHSIIEKRQSTTSEFVAEIVPSQILLFASIAWLIGIYKQKVSWMLAFVVCHFILFGALTILYFVYIGAFFFHLAGRLDLNREYTWIFLIPTLPFLVMEWNFMATVNSLYKNTKEEKKRKPITLYPDIENEL